MDSVDMKLQLIEDIRQVALDICEDTRGEVDLGEVIHAAGGGFVETELRKVDITRDRTATGAATITCQSIRCAILCFVAIWRTWTSTMWPNTVWFDPNPPRHWRVTVKFLMDSQSAIVDSHFGADSSARTAQPQNPAYRATYRAADDLVNQFAATFMNPATLPGAAAAAGAAQEDEEEVAEDTGAGIHAWLGPLDTEEDEFDQDNPPPRGAPWQPGPLAP